MNSMDLFGELSKSEYKNLSPAIAYFERRLNGLDFVRLFLYLFPLNSLQTRT